MKFGVDLYPHFPADLGGVKAFDYAVKMVQAARDNGFDGIFASHHYALGATEGMFQPLPLLARLAGEAPGMTFGTAVYLLSMDNPVEAADLSTTMDIVTGGKFVFGVGQGYRDVEFACFGIPKGTRGKRMEEAVGLVRRLWVEDHVTHEGTYYWAEDVTINPKPVQKPGPPIWTGGDTLNGVERAARIGDSWLCSPRHSKVFIRQAVERYKERRTAMGKSVPPPVFFREMYVAPTREKAEQEIMDSFERLYHVYHQAGQPGERYDRTFQELKEERIITGNPDDVIQEIQRYRDEFGAEYMFFRLYYLGMDPEKSVECIKLFGKEVIPFLT